MSTVTQANEQLTEGNEKLKLQISELKSKLKDERNESGFTTTQFACFTGTSALALLSTRVQVLTPDERGRRHPEGADRLSSRPLLAY